MRDDTGGLSPEVFKTYAVFAAKASHRDGIFCHRDELVPDASTDELFRLGFLAFEDDHVIVPGVRRLIPAVFIV